MILSIDKGLKEFEKINSSSFNSLDIWERQHIQEWIREAPEILGEELLVVSVEFDRFKNSNDRLDILAVDRDGNLVVIELKRDAHAGYADLQALRYASMVSTMTIEKLLPYYKSYQKKFIGFDGITDEEARSKIEEFVNNESFDELSNSPRIILCSEDFSQEITSTVLWLIQNGIDISCVKIKPHVVDNRIIIVPNKILPLQEAKQYLIDIQEKREPNKRRSYRPKTMKVLIENNLIEEGDEIYLKEALPNYIEYNDDDSTFRAVITGKLGQSNSIRWNKNGREYSISNLTWNIFRDLHPEKKDPGGVNGNWHWVTKDGKKLWDLAEEFLDR